MQVTPFGFPFGSFPFAPEAGLPGAGFAQALDQVLASPAPVMPLAAKDVAAPGKAIELAPAAAPAAEIPQQQVPSTLAQLLTTAAPAPAPAAVPVSTVAETPVVAEEAATFESEPAAPMAERPAAKPGKIAVRAAPTPLPGEQGLEPLAEPIAEAPLPNQAPAGPKAGTTGPKRLQKEVAEPLEPMLAVPPTDMPPAQAVPAEAAVLPLAAVPRQPVAESARPAETTGAVTGAARKPATPRGASVDAPAPAVAADGTPAKPDTGVAPIQGRSAEHHDGEAGGDRPAPAFTLKHDAQPAPAPAPAAAPAPATATAPAPAREPELAARPGHLGQALGVEIARKVDLGEESLRVRLNPGELGRVEVTLTFDDGGSLRATVRAESAHALDLLRQDAPDLARTLDQAGIRADAQSFRFESRTGSDSGSAQQQHQQQRSGQHFTGGDEAEAAQPAWHAVRGDGQVDLLA